MARFRLRSLLMFATLCSIALGSVSAKRQYDRRQRDLGFMDGLSNVIEDGSYGIVFCGTCFVSAGSYDRGYFEGDAYLGKNTEEMTVDKRVALVEQTIANDESRDARLAARVLQNLRDGWKQAAISPR